MRRAGTQSVMDLDLKRHAGEEAFPGAPLFFLVYPQSTSGMSKLARVRKHLPALEPPSNIHAEIFAGWGKPSPWPHGWPACNSVDSSRLAILIFALPSGVLFLAFPASAQAKTPCLLPVCSKPPFSLSAGSKNHKRYSCDTGFAGQA